MTKTTAGEEPGGPTAVGPLPTSRRRRWAVLCLGLPCVVLAGAYAWLAVDHREVALWNVIVHESGRYTLGQTVLYFSHFLREVPTAVGMALFLWGVVGTGDRSARRVGPTTIIALFAAMGLVVVAIGRVALDQGASEALRNLAQLYTRDDVTAYGSHWRFHLLSTMWFGVAVQVAAWVGHRYLGGPESAGYGRNPISVAAWAYFLGLTLVFSPSLEPILDPRFIGHQAREILTHATTTLPLGLGIVTMRGGATARWSDRSPRRPGPLLITTLLVIPTYLGIAVFASDAMASGQTDQGLAAMVAGHYFEHSLDLVLVALLVVGLEAVTQSRLHRRPNREGVERQQRAL